ncbi:MAG TPA: GNAT family N-acetyltransferase [Verrucomicrobiae bacterium]|jgi:GNAT superfamily N-acetyltransferase|nr:GNAT family N-acetyltransferase [Verrucomicrobiae bacterium]
MNEILIQDGATGVSICRVSVEMILDLRHRLLRAGMPAEAAQFPGDDDGSTWHVGLFCKAGEKAPVVSCASFMLNSYKEEPAWQLRGMATDNPHQGRGFGAKLLACAEQSILRRSDVRLFWCNARVPAIPFYERQGWVADSEVFDIPTAGPHRKMFKRI